MFQYGRALQAPPLWVSVQNTIQIQGNSSTLFGVKVLIIKTL